VSEESTHSSSVDALMETLAAQGIDDTVAVDSTLGRDIVLQTRGQRTLPEARIAGSDADFVIKSELGRGGMGSVVLAEQRALRRDVAIKRLLHSSETAVAALLHEATVTGQLEHPNIVPVHALVVSDEAPAVVMKRIDGVSWESLIGEAPLDRHLEIFLQVCNAAAFAHSRGIVHRDIKPENVMVGEYGEIYLVDWGIAKRLSDPRGGIAGTPCYLAPEMLDGRADARSDVFLLGASLHHALTGRLLHAGKTISAVVAKARECEAQDYGDELPEELAEVLLRACAKDPQDRFSDVASLREAVVIFREHRSANDLADVATERLVELRASDDYAAAQRLFSEARFGFEQALQAWPECGAAREGLEEALRIMAARELDKRQPEVAATLLDAMHSPPEELRERTSKLREELLLERDRLERLEQDQDRNFGAAARRRAIAALGVFTVLIAMFFAGLRMAYPDYAPPALRLAIVGSVVFTVVSAIALWWRARGEWNLVNRRIAQIVVGGLAFNTLNRYAALITNLDETQILTTDALIVAMIGGALSPYHRTGPVIAVVGVTVSFVGAAFPSIIQALFVSTAIALPLLVLAFRWVGKKRKRRTADPS